MIKVSYHFKQQVENSDIRIRNYLGIGFYRTRDAETNTDEPWPAKVDRKDEDEMNDLKRKK